MLAYRPGMPVAYDINLTIVSLLAAGVITAIGLVVAVFTPRRWGAPIGGGIIGGGVAAMHYLGMEALQLPGHVHWDLALVAASIVLGMVLGMASLMVAVPWQSVRAIWASALLLALAILSHHFTAMGAVEVVPDPTRTITEVALSPGLLAIAVASVTVAILGVSLISALADRRVDDKGRLLGIALDNMDQGVVMFDDAGRLVICNDRYTAMYGLPPRLVKPGAMLADIVRYRAEPGSLQADPARYCADVAEAMAAGRALSMVAETPNGRAISIVNRAIPGSKYWVGTHDDITERRAAERQSTLLGEQQARRAAVDEAITWFRESVEGVLQTVAASVVAMKSTAMALSATSRETTAQTAGAVRTSSEAFGSVDIAATAAGELSKSIAEINRQLRARPMWCAPRRPRRNRRTTTSPTWRRRRRRSTTSSSSSRAWPDRPIFWPLNATIEAARAGAAGKGFAVVASEVKALAVQTAKATDDIGSQIAAVQTSTQSAVRAIGNITGRMQEIQQFTGAIATSVKQQNAATGEISDNVAAAASGTKSVVGVLQRVSSAIADMHKAADTVLAASQAVEKAADSLRGSVDGFLHKVAV
jgi:methyl-accepting chemotaxis protein